MVSLSLNIINFKQVFRVNLEQVISDFTYQNKTNITEEKKNQIEATSSYLQNLYSGMIVLTVILELGSITSLFASARRASIKLHKYMVNNIVNATMQFFDSNFIGNILNRFSKDLSSIDEHLPFVVYQVLRVYL